jgi:hypothetical protein
MNDEPVILRISNHHAPAYGTPPQIEERPGQYLGYFANEFGEQMIFVFDRASGRGKLYSGDAGWDKPYKVVDGLARGLSMRLEEKMWLLACWVAATSSFRRPSHGEERDDTG